MRTTSVRQRHWAAMSSIQVISAAGLKHSLRFSSQRGAHICSSRRADLSKWGCSTFRWLKGCQKCLIWFGGWKCQGKLMSNDCQSAFESLVPQSKKKDASNEMPSSVCWRLVLICVELKSANLLLRWFCSSFRIDCFLHAYPYSILIPCFYCFWALKVELYSDPCPIAYPVYTIHLYFYYYIQFNPCVLLRNRAAISIKRVKICCLASPSSVSMYMCELQ